MLKRNMKIKKILLNIANFLAISFVLLILLLLACILILVLCYVFFLVTEGFLGSFPH